jgi:hypothetical protein
VIELHGADKPTSGDTAVHVAKKWDAFVATEHSLVSLEPCHWTLSSASWIQSALHTFYTIFLILSYHVQLDLQNGLFPHFTINS